ncbi:hypothetical protein V6C20_16715, partial [Caldibacillus thermoamylovorans]
MNLDEFFLCSKKNAYLIYAVSPHSNNAYKSTAPLVKIDISIKGGAFHMPEQKLTIVPVTLH